LVGTIGQLYITWWRGWKWSIVVVGQASERVKTENRVRGNIGWKLSMLEIQ